ncbi:transcription termination/antitermination protein NusG [Methylosinus sp. R-45379]|uniref:transcription termination/antitermination protein NusG n=1 Tax=Methylosinus sp. R-45379 TaxID=980563 RepID=UPI000A6FD165|nr:transcription termination/antitermination protein NusG [Methylosinus sp. R-45379]
MVERWYVVEAYEGKDEEVALRLCAAGFKMLRPVDVKRSHVREKLARSGRHVRRVTKRPRFGRYVFLRAELDGEQGACTIRAVKDMRGVFGFLESGERPSPVPDAMIDFYREFNPGAASETEIARYGAGDRVRILVGPFEGLVAVVEGVDKIGLLRVLLDIFGRPTPLPIEVGHVELVEQGRRPPIKSASKRCANRELAQMA